MKTFKQFNNTNNPVDNPFLSWKSSFGEIRNNNKSTINPFLSWKSSFGEIRNKKINESEEILKHTGKGMVGPEYTPYEDDPDQIHDHPDIDSKIPKESKEHNFIWNYCTTTSYNKKDGHASSGNMNAYLRKRMGDTASAILGNHSPYTVEESIRNLSSVFTPERTNRKSIETYSGIPYRVHQKLSQLKSGDTTHIPGFTSTSTDIDTAKEFARGYNQLSNEQPFPNKNEHSIIKFHVHPGAGLSVAKNSFFSRENEIILHHGTKVNYLGNEKKVDENGFPYTEHHMIAHSDHLPLDNYPHEYE